MAKRSVQQPNRGSQEITDAINKVTKAILANLGHNHSGVETPAGTINGVNKVFTLANTPNAAGSLMVFLNGTYRTAGGEDYTLATATITFVNAPPTGSILKAHYIY